ncbi:MAG TPA: PilN domain-containing protein [Candidatus Elarobacter sp.]|nr:PilN domain-containing protein [Candidatus Elarobacter sp.]
MKRIDYVPTWCERRFGIASPRAVAPEVRAPLAALACAFVFAALLHAFELQRVRDAEAAGAAASSALDRLEADAASARALALDVERLRARSAVIAAVRRSGAERADAIARLTNRLPDGAWLSSLRVEPAGVTLDGRSARLATVAEALRALGTVSTSGAVRLLSVRTEPGRGDVVYALALDRAP